MPFPLSARAALLMAAISLLVPSCDRPVVVDSAAGAAPPGSEVERPIRLERAEGFTATHRSDGTTRVTVLRPWRDAAARYFYCLVPEDVDRWAIDVGERDVSTPPKRVVVMSTTFLPALEMLGKLDTLVGVSVAREVTSPPVLAAIEKGRVKEVGPVTSFDAERLLALAPDVVFTFALGPDDLEQFRPIESAGVTVVVVGDYVEPHPLGRAEWLRFFGLFFGEEKEATRKYEEIRQRYERLRAAAQAAKERPTVLVGNSYRGTWYVPGGKSFMATFIADAGGRYLWADDPSTGVRALDFEAVLAKGRDADFWINTGMWTSRADAVADDPRYRFFRALEAGRVYNNNKRRGDGGGSDFWETGLARPDEVLADLIGVLHPELVGERELVWYHRLPQDPPRGDGPPRR